MTLNIDAILENLFWGGPYKIGDGLPPPVEKPRQAAPKVKPKPVSDWVDMDPIICVDQNNNKYKRYMQKRETPDGTEYRPADRKTTSGVLHTLTDKDLEELTARKVGIKTGERLKILFATEPNISAGRLAKESGKSIRTCENALAAFRAAAGLK